jgi:N4-gp56 family major capsid protein
MANQYSGVQTAGAVTALPQAVMEVYSMDIHHEAQGIMRYNEFVVEKEELGKQPGETIMMTRYNNLGRGGQLQEHVSMETKKMSAAQKAVTVTEWGNAVGNTEKLVHASLDDQMAEGAILLGRDYAVVNDLMCRDTIAGATNVIYAGDRVSRAALVGGTDFFDVEMIRQAVEVMQTNNAPKFGGDDFYICFVHPHQSASLKRDPDWVSANNYANTRALFTGELGRWEDVIFISTTHSQNGAAAASAAGYSAAMVSAATGGASAAHVYESLLFSDGAVGRAVSLPAEMRDGGMSDFGRNHSLAWYAIMGCAILEDDFIVRLESV